MAGNNFVASIDIGTEKIALLAADIEDAGHLRIVAHNFCSSDGVKKGSLFSIDSLARVLTNLIKQTKKDFGYKVELARINISDTHLTCSDGKGKGGCVG